MKTRLILTIAMAMMLVQNTTVAQEQTRGKERPTPEQMAQMKADRIAAELALDDKTSEKFKETYKAYMTDKAAIRNEFKSEKGQKGMSDADIEKSILDGFDKKQKNLDLDRKYYDKFRKFMGPRLIQKMYRLESHQGQRQKAHAPSHSGKPQGGQQNRPQGRPQPR